MRTLTHKAGLRLSRRGWIVVAVIGALLSSFTADAVASVGRVRAGVTVGSLDVGGKNRDEAERLLTERARLISAEPVTFLAVDGEEVTVEPEDLSYFPDVEDTLDRAFAVGRSGHVLARTWQKLRTYFADSDIGWTHSADGETLIATVAAWAERFDDPEAEAGIEAKGTDIVAVPPSEGHVLDPDAGRRVLLRGLARWPRRPAELPFVVSRSRTDLEDAEAAAVEAEKLIEHPVTVTGPDGGTLELAPVVLAPLLEAVPERDGDDWGLRVRFSPERVGAQLAERMSRFEREPRSARIVAAGGSVRIEPHQDGLTFDAEATAEALTEAARRGPPRSVAAALSPEEPSLTTAEAEALNITERVSTFTTNHPCCQPRVTNIHRMADMVDDTLIPPGATFSLNHHVGKRTTDKGFVSAPMIYDGEYKDDVGGGVSQFATTFYNAVFFGGYDFVTHKAHSYYISRYPPGREATISWPAPDLKFRNDSNAGILVKTAYSNTSITVSFYGNDGGRKVRAEAGERTNFTDPPEQRKPNPAMAPGQERVVQRGSQGFDIVVTRIIERDGDTKRERIFTRYKPEPRIIEYGPGTPRPTAPPSATPAPQEPTPTPATTPASTSQAVRREDDGGT